MGALSDLIDLETSAPERSATKRAPRLRILYITPLRAVSRDIALALEAPIRDLQIPFLVETRTGDTSSSIRAKQRDRLPDVLLTTPESLSLLLTRPNARELFADLRCVIVDEWHELLCSKRGTQVELALARLRTFAPQLRTWGMSATIANIDEAAAALVGTTNTAPALIRSSMQREIIIDTVLPTLAERLPWAGHLGLSMLPDTIAALDTAIPTLLFTNTRSQAERWFHAIAISKPEWQPMMALHHGSIERDERERVEMGLKSGDLRLVVATSSLDLGVDFSPVERVVQIGSPKGIARLMQRAGRASHRAFAPCRITCVPSHALELVEIAAVREAIARGEIEPRLPIHKPLDVLAQHLVTVGLGGGFDADAMFDEVRTAWSYRDLTRDEFDWSLALVKDGGGTLKAYPQYHKLQLEGTTYRVTSARIAQHHRLNVGTITGDSSVQISYQHGRSLGRIEESFVANMRSGTRFVFAGKTLQFVEFRDCVARVRPAKGKAHLTPIWSGTKLPISESLSTAIRRSLEQLASDSSTQHPELIASRALASAQLHISRIPAAHETLVEITTSREGHHCFVFPFEGRLVHAGIAALLALRLSRRSPATFHIAVNDYGLELLCDDPFPYADALRDPTLLTTDHLVDDALESINVSELAKLQFREIARVAGLVNQNYPGAAKSGKQLSVNSSLLFDVLNEFDPGNLLIHQARREVLERHFEEGRLHRTLTRLAAHPLLIVPTDRLTPLSLPIVIERQAATLSSETLADRVRKLQQEWTAQDSPQSKPTNPNIQSPGLQSGLGLDDPAKPGRRKQVPDRSSGL